MWLDLRQILKNSPKETQQICWFSVLRHKSKVFTYLLTKIDQNNLRKERR